MAIRRRSGRVVVAGTLPRKSNNRILLRSGRQCPVCKKRMGPLRSVFKKEAVQYRAAFCAGIPASARQGLGCTEHPLVVVADVFYPWRTKGDLSIEFLLDCLTAAGVIRDDRYVVEHRIRKFTSKERPRVEVEVEELEEWPWHGDEAR